MSVIVNRGFFSVLATILAANLLLVAFGPHTAVAQTSSETSDPVVQQLLREMQQLKSEVRHLRERDAQRQTGDHSVSGHSSSASLRKISRTEMPPQPSDPDDTAGAASAPSADCTGIASGSSCYGSCDKCGCDALWGCLCPLKEAPCIDCPRVSTASPYFNVHVFGALKLDMLFSTKRPISPGTPFFLLPESVTGLDQSTVDIHARQSTLGAALTGPQVGSFQSGGMFTAMFYNDAVLVDQYGFLPLQAWGELKNESWRFSAGLQFDVFSPGLPTVLPFSALGASGNSGNSFRGQLRLEHFLRPADDVQWTTQLALSEPITSTIDPEFRLLEDNGWPNVEGRIALGLGPIEGAGAAAKRPVEVGLSGVVGQIRTTVPPTHQIVADVWGVATDFRWQISEAFGFAGEFYTGETLGTYNAGILQNVNAITFEGIRSTGGWIESFFYWTPCLHSHLGYGIDDPRDEDVNVLGRIKNETYFANIIWDFNQAFRVGFEATWRETVYKALPDNEGAGFHTQFQWAF